MWQNKGTTYTLVHEKLVKHILFGGNLLSFSHRLICFLYPSVRIVGATLCLVEFVLKRLGNHADVFIPQIREYEGIIVQCYLLFLLIVLHINATPHTNASYHRRRN